MVDTIGSGLSAQLGIGLEETYGVYEEPDRFFEFNSESIKPDVKKLYSRGRGSGQYQRASRVTTFIVGGGGELDIDAVTKGIGRLLLLAFGQVATTAIGETDENRHRFTNVSDGLAGLSATVQVGRPSADGVVQPFSYVGGKLIKLKLSSAMDDILKIVTTWDFANETTAEDLAVASYPAGAVPFTFLGGTLTLDGDSAATIKGVTIETNRPLKTDRRSFGNHKREPIQNDEFTATGQFESEFESMDAYDAWVSGEQQANLVVSWLGPLIPEETAPYKIVATIPVLEYTGTAPQVDDDDVLDQNLPFKALWDGTNPLITVDLHTDDATP